MNRVFSNLSALLFAALASTAFSSDEHDHGDLKPAASGLGQPRFSAQSELFDAVGILGSDELVLYIDRAGSNEPVVNATVELDSTGVKAVGKFEPTLGEYHFDAKAFSKDGDYPIRLRIRAGRDNDLLTAELDVHRNAVLATAADNGAAWKVWTTWLVAGLIVLSLILFVGGRLFSMRRNRSARIGVAL